MPSDQLDNLNARANELMKADKLEEVIDLLESQVDLVNRDSRLSWNLGWAYFSLERYEEARDRLTRAKELAPGSPAHHWALGTACLKAERYDEAEAHLIEALRLKDAYIGRIMLALTYMKQGKYAEAEAVHAEGIRLRPSERRRLEAYGDFLSDMGRETEAKQMYLKGMKLPCDLGTVG